MHNDDRRTRIDAAPTAVAQQPSLPPLPFPTLAVATVTMPSHRRVSPTDAIHLTFTSIRRNDKTRVTSLDTIYKHPQQPQPYRSHTTVAVPNTDPLTEAASPVHPSQEPSPSPTSATVPVIAIGRGDVESDPTIVGLGIDVANSADAADKTLH
ncbi:hypothetical protein DFQ26_009364, partial [Actinomortierella ambigua]